MVPLLIVRDNGSRYPLEGRVVTIGSSPDCHIVLNTLPARAAHLLFSKGTYLLQRLASGTPVLVNSQPVGAGKMLQHGDTVQVGTVVLTFWDHDAPEKTDGSTVSQLHELIHTAISLLRSSDETLFGDLVASVSRLLRSDAARLVDENASGLERKTIARYPLSVGLDRFSNRAIEWAREARCTVLVHEDAWREDVAKVRSLEKNLVASVMCAPLMEGTAIAGYLYLDRVDKKTPFTEDDRLFCDALLPLFSEILENFRQKRQQQETIARLQQQHRSSSGSFIYESTVMGAVVQLAARLARTDAPVLISGETGTGKELLARFVHDQSGRKDGLYRAVNAGAIPENLIESELFGHEKGAFTGAVARKIGLFESAQGGTVFLDEIGELPMHLQVKLLRVLQESEVVRVGGTETIKVAVRIVAATNRVLDVEVQEGRFRQDLYFRLNVLSLVLPPLRNREGDVLLLAEFFITKYCQQLGFSRKTLTTPARNALLTYGWPGNVRELENVIQKTIIMVDDDRLQAEHFCFAGSPQQQGACSGENDLTLRAARAEAETLAIKSALSKTKGNVSLAGKVLAIDRKWLMKKMGELGIDANSYR